MSFKIPRILCLENDFAKILVNVRLLVKKSKFCNNIYLHNKDILEYAVLVTRGNFIIFDIEDHPIY